MIPRLKSNEVTKYEASKWLALPMLLSNEEMTRFCTECLPFPLIALGGVQAEEEVLVKKESFLAAYAEYLEKILKGSKPVKPSRQLTLGITPSLNDARLMPVEGGVIVKLVAPVIQVEPYTLHYSTEEKKFREMSPSKNRFFWGLRFTFPQLYANPKTGDVEKVTEALYSNAALFKLLQRWARERTRPSTFQVEGKPVNHSSRVGKELYSFLSLSK